MLPKINKILFATDLSENATGALGYAVGLAQATDAEIIVLHVNEALSSDAIVTLQMFIQDKKAREAAMNDRHAAVREMLKMNQKAFWDSLKGDDKKAHERVKSVELVDGHAADVILRRAKDLNCDLIVMGAHDHGSGHTFLGTIAKRVLRRSNIPTLIVPNS